MKVTSKRYPKIYLALTLLLLTNLVSVTPVKAEDTIKRHYEWSYDGLDWTWDLTIPTALYQQYKAVPIQNREQTDAGGYSYLITTQDTYIQELSNSLHEAAEKEKYEPYDEISFILSFVQSLEYAFDNVTTGYDEYPRFPIETLVDNGGDCEDTSILFATLVKNLDYGVVLMNPPRHIAVGVLGNDLPGNYCTLNGKTYYYCETTGENWKIGELPKEYVGVNVTLYEVNENAQYVPGQSQNNEAAIVIIVFVSFGLAFYLVSKSGKGNETIQNQAKKPLINSDTQPLKETRPSLSEPPFFLAKANKVESLEIPAQPVQSEGRTTQKIPFQAEPSHERKEKTPIKYKYCIKCGETLHPEADYCGVCGFRVPQSLG